jgi:hypothetical protein
MTTVRLEPPMPYARPLPVAAMVLGLSALALAAVAAPKAEKPEAHRAAVLQSVADCRAITEDAGRLACFDKAVAALDVAESKGQVMVIDREQVKTVRRQAFGLSLPAFTLFDRGPKEDQVDGVTIELAQAYRSAGKWIFVSTDNVMWAQTDDDAIGDEPHKGSKVAIRKAALGSFFCNVDGQRAVRCERRH